jgi:hypothetical protein
MELPWRILSSLVGFIVLVVAWPYLSAILVAHGIPVDQLAQQLLHFIGTVLRVFLKLMGIAEGNIERWAASR